MKSFKKVCLRDLKLDIEFRKLRQLMTKTGQVKPAAYCVENDQKM